MTPRESGLHAPIPRWVAALLALAVAALAVAADLLAPSNYVPPVLGCAAVVATAWVRDRRFLWGFTLVILLLTWAGAFWGPAPLATSPPTTVVLVNRLLVALTIVVIAGFVHVWIGAQEAVSRARATLEARNTALGAINNELSAREEEIARQNEELQSQSEELERQSEELRIANDELANRERMLAQLLGLSRTLASELSPDEVMATLCQALLDLPNDSVDASALLLRHGTELRSHCHVGFGEAGPRTRAIPYATSFAALVIAGGQTGLLEDLRLRPDLVTLQPEAGEPFRSVLAAPIVSRGQAIGALEVYRRVPAQWTEEQINLITSIAAQASISIETARLFAEVERQKERSETVLRTLPVCVLVADDAECRHVSGNAATAAIYNAALDANFSPTAPLASRIRRTVLREGRPLAPEELPIVRAAKYGEEVHGEELEIVFPTGRRLMVLASAAPFYGPDDRPAGGVCAFTDITAQKTLERELETRRRESEEASVRKTRFLASVSHDIRTPANVISLQAELIKRSAADPELHGRVPELADRLRVNALSLVELVGEVLDLTRFDSGKIELQETEFSLGETIAEECRALAPLAQSKRLQLHCEPVQPAIWVHADRIKLARVLGNLLENAIKFTPAGEVRMSARRLANGGVAIAIRDTGDGIALEHQERIFDEFFQLRNPERDRAKGRGLGLAICKRLVDAMGGTIVVESHGGAGSTFTVALPASAVVTRASPIVPRAAEPPADSATAGAPALAGLRVLLIEDHDDTRHATAQILAGAGAHVTGAANGHAALAALGSTDPHIVLLDLMLPDVDGLEVLRAIRADPPPSLRRVIVLTGDSATRRIEEITRLGADAVLTKPVAPEALVAHVRALGLPV